MELLHLDKDETQVSTSRSASNKTSVRALSCLLSYVFCVCFEDEPAEKHKLWKLKSRISVISFSLFNEWLIFTLSFPFYVMTYKMFSEKKLSQAGQKNNSSDINLFTQIHLTVFVGHSSIFCQNCPMSRTNIQHNSCNFKILRKTSNSCSLW